MTRITTELTPEQQSIADEYGAEAAAYLPQQDTFVIVVPLLLHVALYLNPTSYGSYEDRFCFANATLATIAAAEYGATGVMKYWQKQHTTGIYIHGTSAYPEQAVAGSDDPLYEVEWDATKLQEQYPYRSPLAMLR